MSSSRPCYTDCSEAYAASSVAGEFPLVTEDERHALRRTAHYHRPKERPFMDTERDKTTILIGGLTRKHERFIQAVFQGSGYKCEILPTPDQTAFHVGKEFGNNGQCSPAYFTAGSLIQYLKNLEAGGMARREINDRYIFFTAGSCGPCRFGMYAAEYRLALQSAGFGGFRVIRFQQDHGIRQQSQEPGLKYTLDFGLGMLKSLYFGDVLNDLTHTMRPYEVNPGETDRVMEVCVQDLCDHLRTYKAEDILLKMPSWLSTRVAKQTMLRHTVCVSAKFRDYLYGRECSAVLARCRKRINRIELDRTRVKPIVKIIGEFWAQITEGDGNYRMFEFLEREGAHVQPEAIGTWLTYLLSHARLQMYPRRGLDAKCVEPERWDFRSRFRNELKFQTRRALLILGERVYTAQYHRVIDALGGTAHRLVPQHELAQLADPFYEPLARGGEGYLEVAKNIYYNLNRLCHMVLSLKPFGCMPSSQSDGIQSAVVNRFKDIIFIPIETSGEGEVNAHSRAQMTLGEAKTKAKAEFQEAFARTGRSMDEIRAFVAQHPELRRPFYNVPRSDGVIGVAANFVLHVSKLMNGNSHPGKHLMP
jgi:predicted nucleotide-binding protein (sugar kinase/HSP70/actin superfamily)